MKGWGKKYVFSRCGYQWEMVGPKEMGNEGDYGGYIL
jgi:hypothetical protein